MLELNTRGLIKEVQQHDSDDVAVAQARVLLGSMYEQVADTSRRLEIAESRSPGMATRGSAHDHRLRAELRRELYEAHRLIDGLHRRFPEIARRRGSELRRT